MSYLYKKSNWLWPLLIGHRLVNIVGRSFVELTPRRHVKFRRRLADRPLPLPSWQPAMALAVLSAGV